MSIHIGLINSYEVGDQFSLCIQTNKRTIRFGKGKKLSPHFIGPFRIKEEIRQVSYRIVLPPNLHKTYDFFHVSIL